MALPRKDRERLLMHLASLGLNQHVALQLARCASTLDRLNTAQCNGDWPADNGERKVLPCGGAEGKGCGMYWAPSVLTGAGKVCPDCRAQAKAWRLVEGTGCRIDFAGDPRGMPFTVERVQAVAS